MEIRSTVGLDSRDDLSLAYTPGVARVCEAIADRPEHDPALHVGAQHRRRGHRRHRRARPRRHRPGRRDAGDGGQGRAVQAVRRRRRRSRSAWPPPTSRRSSRRSSRLAPSFGGINLEDISAPRCFEIERRLKELLDIPVFHDDQHGTAVVALAALQNALRLTGRSASGDPGRDLRAPAPPAWRWPGSCSRPGSATSPSSTARACSTPAATT